ncbi:MAG: ABC transporter permease [Ilumatobacter sp.]|uniref:ABC transporter permease n=1 Tax=Ilumatobacter sp. TaxID=1967498 RepID=UPI0032994D3A
MSSFESVRLVMIRELRQATRKKGLWAVFALLFVGSTAAMVLPEVVGGDDSSTDEVVVVGDDPALVDALTALGPALDSRVDVTIVETDTEAARLVEDQEVDIAVTSGDSPEIIVRAGENAALVGAARQALYVTTLTDRLGDAGLSDAQITDSLAVPTAQLRELDVSGQSRRGASVVISLVLYVLLLTGMVQVANGTAIEKSNRISEMLLPVVSPGALLFGKVIGVGIVNVVTLSAGLLPVVVKFSIGGDLPDGIGGALAASAAWFALGLALYLTLAGMLGALVERQEEAGQVVSPLTYLLIATYIAIQSSGDGVFGAVLAYFPLTSPIAAPTRIATGDSSPVEIVGSLVILVATVLVAGRFASTVYARAIVRTGKRLKLRDVMASPRTRPA